MLSGWEWIIILGIAVIVIMWGPAKIPELAKSLGKAKGEFDKASKEYNKAALEQLTAKPTETKVDVKKEEDDGITAVAKKYGVSTEGKTKEQIAVDVLGKIKEPTSS